MSIPSIKATLDSKDYSFELHLSAFSSRIITGKFETNGKKLILHSDDSSDEQYVFIFKSEGKFSFSAKDSADLPVYNYGVNAGKSTPFENGAIFMKEVMKND